MASTSDSSAESDQHAASVSSDTATSSQKRKRDLEEALEEAKDDAKRCKTVIGSVAEEYVCPISTELPVDPVVAEDGRIYERSEIEKHIRARRNDLKSPATNEPMGPRLLPAVQVRNSMKMLVESGTIDGALATRWKERIADEERVKGIRENAAKGNRDAMCNLGRCYYAGLIGVPKDQKRAYEWFKKASDLHHIPGVAMEGILLLRGIGVKKNVSYGATLIGRAAEAGSKGGAYNMGQFHMRGEFGFPKDFAQAKHWLHKATDESCGIQDIHEADVKRAKKFLKELAER